MVASGSKFSCPLDMGYHVKGAFTYDVRCFWGIFDLPTYPNQIKEGCD